MIVKQDTYSDRERKYLKMDRDKAKARWFYQNRKRRRLQDHPWSENRTFDEAKQKKEMVNRATQTQASMEHHYLRFLTLEKHLSAKKSSQLKEICGIIIAWTIGCLILQVYLGNIAFAMEDFTTSDRIPRITKTILEDRVTNLNHGVVFKKKAVLDMSSSHWPHVYKIPHVPRLPPMKEYSITDKIPIKKFRKLAISTVIGNATEPTPEEIADAMDAADRIQRRL